MPCYDDSSFKYLIDLNVNFEILDDLICYQSEMNNLIVNARQWCTENCYDEWMIAGFCFAFVNNIDATLFKLTWG
jgi:hypothetical protein